MTTKEIYPTKTLRYKICEFFLNKRIDSPGLGVPLNINLVDMRYLLDYATGSNDEKIIKLWIELNELNKEAFGADMERNVIDIFHFPDNNEEFITIFKNGSILQVRCLSKNIEDYMTELKERTQAARRHYGLVELIPLSGGVKIVLGDKEMSIGKSKNNDIDLHINIVKLLYGDSVNLPDGDITLEEDYKRGDLVVLDDLVNILQMIEGTDGDNNPTSDNKAVYDAVRNLNTRSVTFFGRPLFNLDRGIVNWIL